MARLEALTTGQLLDRIFSLYRKNFVLFFLIGAIPQISRVSGPLAAVIPGLSKSAGLGGMIVGGLIWFALYISAVALSQGATTVAVSDIYLDRPTSVKHSYAKVFPMTLRLIGMMLGFGLLVGIGFVLLIAPGVYFFVTYALATPTMAIENVSFSEAMTRSKDLVAGNRGRIAVIFLLSIVISWTVAFALAFPVTYFTAKLLLGNLFLRTAINSVVQIIAAAISTPISLIGFTLAYYDARVRKEAFDLEYMMESEAALMPPVEAPVEAMAASAAMNSSTTHVAGTMSSAGDAVAASTGGSSFMLFDEPSPSTTPAPTQEPPQEPKATTEG
jgi:hypothetical protein